jgi:hypothetical protein
VKVIGKYSIALSQHKFEDINDQPSYIYTAGFIMKVIYQQNQDSTIGSAIFRAYRLFEDGSLSAQYVELAPEKAANVLNTLTQPQYQIDNPNKLDLLIQNSKRAMIPSRVCESGRVMELQRITMDSFQDYLHTQVTPGSEQLEEDSKTQIASRVRQLKAPTLL